MTPISLDAAAIVTERSKRTWQRRIIEGLATKVDNDASGRAMVPIEDVAPMIVVEMSPEDLTYLAAADAGDAEAQDDMGQLFLQQGKHEAAMYWLRLAAEQEYPNAMQTLGRCYVAGEGVPRNEHLGVMWLAKAAAAGHSIAQAQMQGLGVGRSST